MLFGTERNRKCVLLSVTGVYVLNTCCAHCQFARMPVVVCVCVCVPVGGVVHGIGVARGHRSASVHNSLTPLA